MLHINWSIHLHTDLDAANMSLVAYLLINSFFAVMDLTSRPRFLLKYKIQDAKPVSLRNTTCQETINIIQFYRLNGRLTDIV